MGRGHASDNYPSTPKSLAQATTCCSSFWWSPFIALVMLNLRIDSPVRILCLVAGDQLVETRRLTDESRVERRLPCDLPRPTRVNDRLTDACSDLQLMRSVTGHRCSRSPFHGQDISRQSAAPYQVEQSQHIISWNPALAGKVKGKQITYSFEIGEQIPPRLITHRKNVFPSVWLRHSDITEVRKE